MTRDGERVWVTRRVVASGSGNVAIYAAAKAAEMGAQVVACSDSSGYVVDEAGLDIDLLRRVKEVDRARISAYAEEREGARYVEGGDVWEVACEVALPCATQNELDAGAATTLVENGVLAVAEGANMPCTPKAVDILQENGVLFAPGKASNAGGVATSGLEMAQNSARLSWSRAKVDKKLEEIMVNIHKAAFETAEKYGKPGNYVFGANIAGFLKIAQAMMAQGVV